MAESIFNQVPGLQDLLQDLSFTCTLKIFFSLGKTFKKISSNFYKLCSSKKMLNVKLCSQKHI